MDGIQFEEDEYNKQPVVTTSEKGSWYVKIVMKLGGKYIKDEKEAQGVLLIVAIIFFSLSIYFFFF